MASTQIDALKGIYSLVDEVLNDKVQNDDKLPVPLPQENLKDLAFEISIVFILATTLVLLACILIL